MINYLTNWFWCSILGIFIFNTIYQMNNTSIDIIRHDSDKTILRQNFQRFAPNAKYQLFKLGKYITLHDYIQIHNLFLDKSHMTIFTFLINATRTIQCVMYKGTFIHITGEKNIQERLVITTKPGYLKFELPGNGFRMKIHISEPIELVWKDKKYSNVLCVCRRYF